MKKALFVYLGEEREFMVKVRKSEWGLKRVPQLGFQYLAAVLKTKGIETKILDQAVNYFSFDEVVEHIKRDSYLFVGFYSDTAMKKRVKFWISKLKSKVSLPIILGGPGYFSSEEYLNSGADIVVNGEAERTICQIVDYLNGKMALKDVKGVSHVQDGKVVKAPDQPLIENLEEIPFPLRDGNDLLKYRDLRIFNMRRPFATLITSRGCFRKCTFCSVPQLSRGRLRMRSPKNVISEIDGIVRKYGIRYIKIEDDMFGVDWRWTEKFLGLLARRKYDLLWSCQTYPFTFCKDREKRLGLFKKAGCDFIIFGLQSANPTILKNIKRDSREPEELQKNVQMCKRVGINTVVEFIFGLPGETEETLKENVRYALRVKPTYVQFYPLLKIEGSEIYEKYRDSSPSKFSAEEIERWCRRAMRKFYANPKVFLPFGIKVLVQHPRFLLIGGKYLFHLLYH